LYVQIENSFGIDAQRSGTSLSPETNLDLETGSDRQTKVELITDETKTRKKRKFKLKKLSRDTVNLKKELILVTRHFSFVL